MAAIGLIQDLWRHSMWADTRLLAKIEQGGAALPSAVHEFAHMIAAQELWLTRLQGRPVQPVVWPELTLAELRPRLAQAHAAFNAYLANLQPDDLFAASTYATSDGRTFTNVVAEILLHLPLHAQYHRGRINLLLRQAEAEPAPVDYIAFAREGSGGDNLSTARRAP